MIGYICEQAQGEKNTMKKAFQSFLSHTESLCVNG